MTKPLGKENKAFMSKPGEDYERLMSGRTHDSQGTPKFLQDISLFLRKSLGYHRKEGNKFI